VPGPFDLAGRVALVTGSSRGIGRALALGLAQAGARVALHGAGPGGALDAAVAAAGPGARGFPADLADDAACRGLVAAVSRAMGPPDILVLNASHEARAPWTAIDAASFERHVAVNLRATLVLLQETVPGMAERGWGRVVTLGSIQETRPNPALLLYAALKSAQTTLAFGLAREVAGRGVTINNLAPGAILTDRNAGVLADPAYEARVRGLIPAGRVGAPEDCVAACLLLCSDAGGYITGATIPVDGGWHRA
jgi:glucose 1-dehydrogenase